MDLTVILLILLAIFWIIMFANMMTFADRDLPGKNDKILWTIVFILLPFLAPFGFWAFKHSYRARLEAERNIKKLKKVMRNIDGSEAPQARDDAATDEGP